MAARKTSSNLSRGNQRKVAPGIKDAFFRNAYRDKMGELGKLTCGIVTFKPGEIRWCSAQAQMRSGNGFAKGVEMGWLIGPADTEEELQIDLDLEENPDTDARVPELPDENDNVTTATDEAAQGVETVPVGGGDSEPAEEPPAAEEPMKAAADATPVVTEEQPPPSEPPPPEDPPPSVEMPTDNEDPPASVDNDPLPVKDDDDLEATDPVAKAPSAKDLIAGARKSKKSKKG